MNTSRQQARSYLDSASLESFWHIVKAAKITDEDQRVLDLKFIHCLGNLEISEQLNMSLEKVNKIIRKSYDKIYNLL